MAKMTDNGSTSVAVEGVWPTSPHLAPYKYEYMQY